MSLWPEAEEWELTIGERHWAGLAFGDRDAPPALALHGWLDNAGSLVPLARALPRHRWWIPDLPGHGRSSHRPAGTWYHFVDYVSDLIALADALQLPQFDLVGHSMGGAIATLIAGAFPERIARLVLIEAIGPLSRPADQAPQDLRKAVLARLALRQKPLKVHPRRELAIAARMHANQLSETAAEYLIERAMVAVDGGFVWSSDQRQTLPTPMRGTQAQYLAFIEAILAPTLLILTDPPTSYLVGPESDARINALAPAQLLRLPGGHHLHLENAAGVSAAIAAFLLEYPATAVQLTAAE